MFPSYAPYIPQNFCHCHHQCHEHEHQHHHNPLKLHNVDAVSPLNEFFNIVMILDESGSMENIRYKMIESINSLIEEQKQVKERPATFTLVKFNNNINRVINYKKLNEITNLTSNDYVPNGSTALFDAIGNTINWFRNERNVLLIIVTDGQENASHEYTRQEIMHMIEDKQKNNGWTYVYLSSDVNTFTQGNDLGFGMSKYSANVMNVRFYDSEIQNVSNAVRNYRSAGISVQQQLNSK